MLYQWEMTGRPEREVVESMAAIRNPSPEARAFGRSLFMGTVRHLEEVDARLEEHSEAWRLDRMAAVDRNILRVAVYELLHTETPPSVVINEALEIAKRFSGPDAAGFVNGVLDAVRQQLEAAPERP